MRETTLIVLAKEPVAGRVKTRLCPPCTPNQAADIARAALADTLDAVAATPARRRVVVLDGEPGPWLPAGVEVIAQRGIGLDQRLAAAFADVGGPAVLIGMDTPQVTACDLAGVVGALSQPGVDGVIGEANDGGYWTIGLRTPERAVFLDVPMSSAHTATAQRQRFVDLGLRVAEVGMLTDVDTFDEAQAVAHLVPDGRFGIAVATAVPEIHPAFSRHQERVTGQPRHRPSTFRFS